MNCKQYNITAVVIGLICVVSIAQAQYDRAQSGGDFPLPVTMLSFAAAGGDHSVTLRWRTASEVDMAGFNLYRSLGMNGNFARINPQLVPAQGTGTEIREYQYRDVDLNNGLHYYYKLSTVEISGREEIIEPAILGIAGNSAEHSWSLPPDYDLLNFLSLNGNYPEPFNGQTRISFSVYEQSPVKLEVYSVAGKKVKLLVDGNLPPGEYVAEFQGEMLPSGIYFCRLQGAKGFDTVRKIVLLR
jgi:hypothetical protein